MDLARLHAMKRVGRYVTIAMLVGLLSTVTATTGCFLRGLNKGSGGGGTNLGSNDPRPHPCFASGGGGGGGGC